jgi:3-methylfumaryl-CoA hydratase
MDRIDLARAKALQATLGDTQHKIAEGAPLPPLWHWIYFWQVAPPDRLSPDGHPVRGDFLPPVALPRRMWAGSRVSFPGSLPIGAEVERRSRISRIAPKRGRSGALLLLTVEHTITVGGDVAVTEEQDIVFRDAGSAATPAAETGAPTPTDPSPWHADFIPTPPLLFRYSALTMNAHRIHYDLPYAQQVESYPALVVQGPLLATILAGFASRNAGQAMAEFGFRAAAPVFEGRSYRLLGGPTPKGAQVAVTDNRHARLLTAEIVWQAGAAATRDLNA